MLNCLEHYLALVQQIQMGLTVYHLMTDRLLSKDPSALHLVTESQKLMEVLALEKLSVHVNIDKMFCLRT